MDQTPVDYKSIPPMNGCPECTSLWSKCDSKAYVAHIWEHVPKPKKVYAYTLTTGGDDVPAETAKLCEAVWKLHTQKSVPILEGGAYLEYTKEGRPHIHGWYVTEDGGRIFAKVFQRCWPNWKEKRGMTQFPGGYHELMKTNRYLGYASAEGRLVCSKNSNEPARYEM